MEISGAVCGGPQSYEVHRPFSCALTLSPISMVLMGSEKMNSDSLAAGPMSSGRKVSTALSSRNELYTSHLSRCH